MFRKKLEHHSKAITIRIVCQIINKIFEIVIYKYMKPLIKITFRMSPCIAENNTRIQTRIVLLIKQRYFPGYFPRFPIGNLRVFPPGRARCRFRRTRISLCLLIQFSPSRSNRSNVLEYRIINSAHNTSRRSDKLTNNSSLIRTILEVDNNKCGRFDRHCVAEGTCGFRVRFRGVF